jgi:opacity protein-like surface antigen
MYRKIFISIFIISLSVAAKGQGNQYPVFTDELIGFSWDVNIPINNTFTNKTSFDGFQVDYRKAIKHDMSIGLELGWSGYDEYYPRKTYPIHNGAITTDFYSYLYTLPMAVTLHHYFHVNNKIYPYAGLGLGATYAEMKLYYNTYVSSDYNWGFLVRPELGAIFKFSDNDRWGIILGARYNYSTNKNSGFNIDGLQSVGFQLGIAAMK